MNVNIQELFRRLYENCSKDVIKEICHRCGPVGYARNIVKCGDYCILQFLKFYVECDDEKSERIKYCILKLENRAVRITETKVYPF